MSEPSRRPPPSVEGDEPPADEEYARTYAAGFEEGLRSALKELLGHASRGHTNQELRALIQSRLARLAEEVDLKRRSLLGPPRPRPWDALGRGPTAPLPSPELVPAFRLDAGMSVLVREERPRRAVEIVRSNLGRFPRVVVVSAGNSDLGLAGSERTTFVRVTEQGTAVPHRLTGGEVLGRLKEPTESPGGALVYVDALEYLVPEEGLETMHRFAHYLVDQVQRTGSAAVVSVDPRSFDVKDQSRLERTFSRVV